jgi:capsular polysaccharide export protein
MSLALTGPLFAHGFSWRKQALLRAFTGRRDIRFVGKGSDVLPAATLLLWGMAPVPAGVLPDARIVRVEDGFVRSVGLGADLTRPVSWVLDNVGIYYDATRPSALEQLLRGAAFSPELLARAAALRERIVASGLTKYNLASVAWRPQSSGRRVVLVPGQVETDAAIACGAATVRTNLALLQAVRTARPDAWVVYKPHPDVVAGLRGRGQGEDLASRYCDEVVHEGSMHDLLQHVDEVHVITSLAGFEALLRHKPVVCHGWPFFAGYGLTQDTHAHPRRPGAGLTLDALVAAALIEYPVYLSRVSGERCGPEQALDELLAWREQQPQGVARWRKWLRPLIARP